MRIQIKGTSNIEKDFRVIFQPVANDFNSVTIAGGNDLTIETDTFFDFDNAPVTFDIWVKLYTYIPSHSEPNGFIFYYDLFKVNLKKIIEGKQTIKDYYQSRNMIKRMETVRHNFLYLMKYEVSSHSMKKVTLEQYIKDTDTDPTKFI